MHSNHSFLDAGSDASHNTRGDKFSDAQELLGSDLPGSQAADNASNSLESNRDYTPFRHSTTLRSSEGRFSSEIVEGTDEHLTISESGKFMSQEGSRSGSARDRASSELQRSMEEAAEVRRRSTERQAAIEERQRRHSMASSTQSGSEDDKPYVRLSQVNL